MNILEKPLRKLAFSLGTRYVTDLVKGAAEGKRGPTARAIYWALAGRKRAVAVLVVGVAVVCGAIGYLQAAAYVFAAGAFLYAVGLLDAGWRDVRPADVFGTSPVYRFAAANAATITALLATAAAVVDAGHCGRFDCDVLERILVGTGAGLAYLGCADSAWRTAPPLVQVPRK